MATGSSATPWIVTIVVAIIAALGAVAAAVLPGLLDGGDGESGSSDTSTREEQPAPEQPEQPEQAEQPGQVTPLTIQGEATAEREVGLQLGDEGGIGFLGYTTDGTWATYESGALGSGEVRSITARVASDSTGGDIAIRLDDANGPLIGQCSVPYTGGWLSWQVVQCDVLDDVASAPSELHLEFTRGASRDENPYLFNLDWVEIE